MIIRPLKFSLLPSIEIDTELYELWKKGMGIKRKAKKIYKKAMEEFYGNNDVMFSKKAKGLIVRSSAVKSEDGEMTSGAGIYESIGNINTFEDFYDAIVEVFESIDSEKAVAHRKEFGIEEEKMGLVIMPFISVEQNRLGYVNTSRIGKPHLLDMKDGDGRLITFRKDLLPVDMEENLHFSSFISAMYNPDTSGTLNYQSDNNERFGFQIDEVGFTYNLPLMFFMEKYFGFPLQFEFVSASGRMAHEHEVFVVQMRPLVYSEHVSSTPDFPKQKAIYEGFCVIPGDIILESKDIFTSETSHYATENGVLNHFGEDGYKAAVIDNTFGTMSGHIETLCTEKGILCVCGSMHNPLNSFNFSQYDKLRIVSDGEVARIYPIHS